MCLWRLWVGTSYTSSKVRTEVPVMLKSPMYSLFVLSWELQLFFSMNGSQSKINQRHRKHDSVGGGGPLGAHVSEFQLLAGAVWKKLALKQVVQKLDHWGQNSETTEQILVSLFLNCNIQVLAFYRPTSQSEAKGSFTIQPHKRWANWGSMVSSSDMFCHWPSGFRLQAIQ